MSNLELKGLKLLRNLDSTPVEDKTDPNEKLILLATNLLSPGKYQPRKQFDESILDELAASIKTQGIIQPLVVRKTAASSYEIVAGERRWRAAQRVGLAQVPVVVRDIDDNAALAFSLIENIQRENLNCMEEAAAFVRFRDEFQMTHEEIAHMIGRSRTSVTNTMRLLTLEPRVRLMLEERKIEMGHARAILKLNHEQQYQTACMIIEKQSSVREAEALANSAKLLKNKKMSLNKNHDKCNDWSHQLSQKFATSVSVKINEEGKGRVIIEINSINEMNLIMEGI
ncbi:MAG: ParB/RepB/Spo0J family partition protein [Gammaproteobacteria bacterium]|nr:ParB/RepB/Spo0J family partition protein [Gammaproteobacteria bacterium]